MAAFWLAVPTRSRVCKCSRLTRTEYRSALTLQVRELEQCVRGKNEFARLPFFVRNSTNWGQIPVTKGILDLRTRSERHTTVDAVLWEYNESDTHN